MAMTGRSPSRELNARTLILGALLSAVLSGANAYLGLFAGMTVSASIPAAVISMGILRPFGGTILENNQVQTAASAGESAAAGAIFTLPALVILGAWSRFDLLLCGVLIAIGGALGVLFTILLRPALVVPETLPFPEGAATAEILRAGHGLSSAPEQESRGALSLLVMGSVWGALVKFAESGLSLSRAAVEVAVTSGQKVFYLGTGTSPALIAVGYIVGLEVAVVIFLGGAFNWLGVLPFVAQPEEGATALQSAWKAWSEKTRFLGVGAMTVGGIFTLGQVRGPILAAVAAGFSAFNFRAKAAPGAALHERDLPARWVMSALLLSVVPLYFVFYHVTGAALLAAIVSVLVLLFGFLFSSVAAYMAGLVGSSNNPVSGVTIATILFTSLFLSTCGAFLSGGSAAQVGPAAALLVGSIVCVAAAIGGDNVQDLRAGQLVGATPYRQQIMQFVGVAVAALVLGSVLQLLLNAYGFGAPSEQHPHALRAPQATLMASVATGVYGGDLPWKFVFAGAALGALVALIDFLLVRAKSRMRVSVMAFALGLYLPWELSGPVLLGGVLAWQTSRGKSGRRSALGVLLAAGLITGEALMGIALAVAVAGWGGFGALLTVGKAESTLLTLIFVAITVVLFARVRKGSAASEVRS